jgi:hypothetical protein
MIPILVSAPGRSGTTLMMRLLSQARDVAVAKTPPFEVRLLAYYAYAYRVMTNAPDIERSTHPDRLAGNGLPIGFNPYTAGSFAGAMDPTLLKQYTSGSVPSILRAAFRDCVRAYYLLIDPNAKFFAEKNDSLSECVIAFTALAFGGIRRIFMLRDPRDLYCSHRSYFGSTPEKAAADVSFAMRKMLQIHERAERDVLIIRYEDLVRKAEATKAALEKFVGIRIGAADDAAGFASHGTSKSREESIGRWQTDMDADQQARFIPTWQPAMNAYGYTD